MSIFKCMREMKKLHDQYKTATHGIQLLTSYDGTITIHNSIKFCQEYSNQFALIEQAYHIAMFHCTCEKCADYFNENFK